MFGTPRRVGRPVLLILVYGIFMVIVGLTAVAQTVLVSADFSATTLNSTVGADGAMVRLFVSSSLSPDDLGPAGISAARQSTLDERLGSLVRPGQILRGGGVRLNPATGQYELPNGDVARRAAAEGHF